MTGNEWIEAFGSELGLETPTEEEIDRLLDLAGVAAHASERIAAPIACWLVGRAGIDTAEAREIAERLG